MAEIVVVCPFCHRTVRVPIRFGSRRVRCPECSERGYVADPYHLPDERESGPLVGESIQNCVIEERLGQDTFNVFFRAFDEEAETPVLVRVPRPEWARERQHAGEALRVEMIAAGIEHPNLLAAARAGEDLRRAIRYAILPMAPLLTLDEYLRAEGPLPEKQVAVIGSLLADALSKLHDLGIVHLAICAANVVLTEDQFPALKGFEFARFLPGDGALPIIMRYPMHLSPEQTSGHPVDERSDVYSLGETLRFALGGSGVTPDLLAIIRRMVEADPGARFGSCREVRDALDQLLGNEAPSHERALGTPNRARRRSTVPWCVDEFTWVQQEIRGILDRPKDDWKVEGWRRQEPASREFFRPATYHRDNQIALVFLKRYHHAPTACEEHLARYQWIGAFFAAHGEELERRGLIVADHTSDTFGVRREIIQRLCDAGLPAGQAGEQSELNATLRAVVADEDFAAWVAVDSACFPQVTRRPDPWDPDY